MRCPVCQGLSIADSPAASATSMLDQVRDLFAEGYDEQQILDYFVRSYGEFVLLQPRARGFNLVVWLAPLAAVALGLLLLSRRLRRRPDQALGKEQEEEGLAEYLERVRTEVGN
jgi:cytochrome c-type biogenesis protein CcmH